MNNKILVEVFVPAASQKYDIFIPLESKMSEVTKLVANALSDLSEGKYRATEQAVLCDANTGDIFDVNIEVGELNLENGSRLMLI